jgi:acetyltransferase-like isoleucine patch superfamily enzyme
MDLTFVYRTLVRTGWLELLDRLVMRIKRMFTQYRYDLYRSQYDVHHTFFKVRNEGIQLYGDGEIHTGPGSYIGRYSRIRAGEGTHVRIGSGCAISHDVAIYATSWVSDQDFSDRSPYSDHSPYNLGDLMSYSDDVVINDNVWIGYSVFITPGTEVGENSVIGANAVVTRDIPPHSIAVGTPAEVIRFKNYITEEKMRELAGQYRDVLSDELREEYESSTDGIQ